MIGHIFHTYQMSSINETPTVLFKDNAACIAQIKSGYIKGDWTKHISPKFFYTHELHKNIEIDVHQICWSENLIYLFTKSLPTSVFDRFVSLIGMHCLKVLYSSGEAN